MKTAELRSVPRNVMTQQVTVCVVDDDASVLRALGRLLRAAGFRVGAFTSSEEFLDSPLRDMTRCLVLDIRLRGMNGVNLCEHLSSTSAGLPVILMTAHDDIVTRDRAVRAGAVAYLRKPFTDRTLVSAIQEALKRERRPRPGERGTDARFG